MSESEMQAELERLRAENAQLKSKDKLLCLAAHPDALPSTASIACASAHGPGDICTRRAGVGAAGISYARPGTATARFS